jgi:RND family efflux transporter MFP subunit
MKHRSTTRAALFLGATVTLAACGGGSEAEAKGPVEITLGPEAVEIVSAAAVSSGPVLSGTLAAERQATVNAQSAGTVLQVSADRGQPVRAGQTLGRIDDSAIGDAVVSAQSGVRSAQIAVSTAQRNAERAATLNGAGAVSDRDLELARTQLATSQAQLADARTRLAQAQRQQANTVITAPIGGVVSARPVSAGDVVQPGTPLFTIVDPGSMRLEAAVPAEQLGALRVGTPVRFTSSAYPGRTFTGTIQRISPAADPQTRQIPVVVTLPNSDGALVAGLFAEGRVEAQTRTAITVPVDAVDERGVAPTVLRVRGGRTERAPVQLGTRDSETDRVEITSGLAPGDTVLVGAAVGTTPGTPVRVRAAGAAPAGAR